MLMDRETSIAAAGCHYGVDQSLVCFIKKMTVIKTSAPSSLKISCVSHHYFFLKRWEGLLSMAGIWRRRLSLHRIGKYIKT